MVARSSRSFSIAFVLVTLLVAVLGPAVTARAKDCSNTSTGLIPLTDLGTGTYQGEVGGLYPNGSNEVPDQHLELGLRLASEVVPRAEDGTPDENGLIGFISFGVSNTAGQFRAFTEKVLTSETNPALVLVNGAQIGRALGVWARPSETRHPVWDTVEDRVARQGLTADQIQVAWVMLPGVTRGPSTLSDARDEMEQLTRVLQFAKERYPNLVLAYLSSRAYGGYIEDAESEPNAYHHGFEVKWVIEEQISGLAALNSDPEQGTVESPWISWGPYTWADGTTPRSDGLVWLCDDFTERGVHLAERGEEKVATLMMEHFLTDETAAGWFPGSGERQSSSSTVTTTVTSTPETPSPSIAETTVESMPSTSSSVVAAEEDSDSQDSGDAPDPWLVALTGLGAALVLGGLAAMVIRRSKAGPGEN